MIWLYLNIRNIFSVWFNFFIYIMVFCLWLNIVELDKIVILGKKDRISFILIDLFCKMGINNWLINN